MREMEYDSASSCDGRLKDLETTEELPRIIIEKNQAERELPTRQQWISTEKTVASGRPFSVTERSLSAQVMEYYHKYSQNTSLGRYFSLPESGIAANGVNYYHRMYESIPETGASREHYVILASEERSRIDSSTPRERRRWARPPLIGQPSSSEGAVPSTYVSVSSIDSRTPSPICKRPTTETIPEERNESSRENLGQVKDPEGKASSPTSSVASHKPLEWDSGADVGYYNALPLSKEKDKKLCTIERMALARGCSAALRLDPEGTNESSGSINQATGSRVTTRHSMKPDANSTPLRGIRHLESGESESEIEITPIVKNHSSGIISGCPEVCNKGGFSRDDKNPKNVARQLGPPEKTTVSSAVSEKSKESNKESELLPLKKSASMNLLVFPLSRLSLKRSQSELNLRVKEKKNAHPLPPIIFNSTSSIATVVNKPSTCDKFIQTNLDTCSRESIGIQVSVTDTSEDSTNEAPHCNIEEAKKTDEEEEKPPLPKRASSLVPKSLHSILKNSSNTYNVRDKRGNGARGQTNGNRKASDGAERGNKAEDNDRVDGPTETPNKTTDRDTRGVGKTDSSSGNSSISNPLRNDSSSEKSAQIPVDEDTTAENAAGRASNSFEYFPGHVYQNVRNGSTSHVSSVDTGRESRCSTMPNTSSSIDEKLWGDSDSLVRDLERSVNILKSLVDANKCDKQVKKRLIHHVIKRLVTAKYTDDRIEHDLDENVPWNPADARNKVYRNEIIQALANKHNTTDSSVDDWRPRKRNVARGSSASPKKTITSKEARVAKEIIELVATSAQSTPNSDEFPFDRHTDRTVMDGRKARMGLRCEDRRRENANTDHERSESSECFLPQSHSSKQPGYTLKSTNVYYTMNDDKSKEKSRPAPSPTFNGAETTADAPATTTSTSTTSKSTACHRNHGNDAIVLVKEHRRTESNETDWRLPTTMSERRFEMGRCGNSESGDTKLINYAEMEKKNQLVWITNEISHLCNLKRLLQEPNKFNGRDRGSNSPKKKIDQWSTRPRSSRRNRNEESRISESETGHDDKRLTRDEFKGKNIENHGQWSSHGNLNGGATTNEYQQTSPRNRGDDRTDVRSARHTRKLRNSCTQTGSDGGPSGHSKTGGEIISSTIPALVSITSARVNRTIARSVCDASVQTLSGSPRKLTNSMLTEHVHLSTCPTRVRSNDDEKNLQRHVCYCQRYAAHSRHSACIVDSARRCARDHAKHCSYRAREERPIIITATNSQTVPNLKSMATNSKSNDSRKEAKNQLNANCKSKYAIRELPTKTKARCAECELHEKILSGARVTKESETVLRTNDRRINGVSKNCVCSIECNCGARKNRKSDDDRVNEKHLEDDEQRSVYSETSSELEDPSYRHTEKFTQSRTCKKCEHDTEDLRLVNDNEIETKKKPLFNATKKSNTENTRKSCRTCGTVWPVRDGITANRKCSCIQDYLKPVAYELKFDDTSEETSRNGGEMKIDKISAKDLPMTKNDETKTTKSPPNSVKSRGKYVSPEDDEKIDVHDDEDEKQRPETLKDFLATNKPQFLENVETRRQYMSEISQLRQLKKEKRKQFLAMAGSSVFLKPQRPAKGSTTNAQRKMSENEMKQRLRLRYLRLNEVRSKRREREKEEEARRNHLMAKLFGQKLQEKVLRGQVDLSQSVSVISNI